MKVETMRGKQITIGKLVVQIPSSIPTTDAEIIEHEGTIALIQREIAHPEAIVKLGRATVELLREDITAAMMQREQEERTGVRQETFKMDVPEGPKRPQLEGGVTVLQIEGPGKRRKAK